MMSDSGWLELRLKMDGKTTAERFQIAQEHEKECRERYDQAKSDLLEAERLRIEMGAAYMREYFPTDRVT